MDLAAVFLDSEPMDGTLGIFQYVGLDVYRFKAG